MNVHVRLTHNLYEVYAQSVRGLGTFASFRLIVAKLGTAGGPDYTA